MALTFMRCLQRRSPILAATTAVRLARRGIIDVQEFNDMILHETDLPPKDPDYLKVVTQEYFRLKYGIKKWINVYGPGSDPKGRNNRPVLKRLAVVLPLVITADKVIPVPFIVDTGAPYAVYLGSKPLEILDKMGIVEEVITITGCPYIVKAALCCGPGEKRLEPVPVCRVPYPYESKTTGTLGDIRCNILGLKGISILGALEFHYSE